MWPGIRPDFHYRTRDDMQHLRKLDIHHMRAGVDSLCAAEARGNGSMEVDLFPVSGSAVKCGLRKDRPKEQRYHLWTLLGTDVRHFGEGEFDQALVFACLECGADKFKRVHPRHKIVQPVRKMDPVKKSYRDALRRHLYDTGATGQEREQALRDFDNFWGDEEVN